MTNQSIFPEGIYPALLTPFKKDGKTVDLDVVTEMVALFKLQGTKGAYIGGTTAQREFLSVQERKEIFETVIRANSKPNSLALIAHVGCDNEKGPNLEQAIELGIHARNHGAVAISALTPKMDSAKELIGFYSELAKGVQCPVIIYNFPKKTGIALDMVVLNELAAIPEIAGIKFTNQDFYLLERIGEHIPSWTRFSGSDEAFAASLATGTRRAIGSTYNFMGPFFEKIKNFYVGPSVVHAGKLQSLANNVIESLKELRATTGNPGAFLTGVKYAVGYLHEIECGPHESEPVLTKENTINLRKNLDAIRMYF
jgi:N-acetylneuraminate lyase